MTTWWRPRAALVAITFIAGATLACGSRESLPAHQYIARNARLAAGLERSYAGQSPATVSANDAVGAFRSKEMHLRTFAAGLDDTVPPSEARDAHHDLTVASKNLADAARRNATTIATPQHAPATGEATGNTVFVRDWVRACHRLQDRATADKIDADLRCASALHEDGTGG